LNGPVYISAMTISNGLVVGADGADGALGMNGQNGGDAHGGGLLATCVVLLSNCWFTENVVIGGQGRRGGGNKSRTPLRSRGWRVWGRGFWSGGIPGRRWLYRGNQMHLFLEYSDRRQGGIWRNQLQFYSDESRWEWRKRRSGRRRRGRL